MFIVKSGRVRNCSSIVRMGANMWKRAAGLVIVGTIFCIYSTGFGEDYPIDTNKTRERSSSQGGQEAHERLRQEAHTDGPEAHARPRRSDGEEATRDDSPGLTDPGVLEDHREPLERRRRQLSSRRESLRFGSRIGQRKSRLHIQSAQLEQYLQLLPQQLKESADEFVRNQRQIKFKSSYQELPAVILKATPNATKSKSLSYFVKVDTEEELPSSLALASLPALSSTYFIPDEDHPPPDTRLLTLAPPAGDKSPKSKPDSASKALSAEFSPERLTPSKDSLTHRLNKLPSDLDRTATSSGLTEDSVTEEYLATTITPVLLLDSSVSVASPSSSASSSPSSLPPPPPSSPFPPLTTLTTSQAISSSPSGVSAGSSTSFSLPSSPSVVTSPHRSRPQPSPKHLQNDFGLQPPPLLPLPRQPLQKQVRDPRPSLPALPTSLEPPHHPFQPKRFLEPLLSGQVPLGGTQPPPRPPQPRNLFKASVNPAVTQLLRDSVDHEKVVASSSNAVSINADDPVCSEDSSSSSSSRTINRKGNNGNIKTNNRGNFGNRSSRRGTVRCSPFSTNKFNDDEDARAQTGKVLIDGKRLPFGNGGGGLRAKPRPDTDAFRLSSPILRPEAGTAGAFSGSSSNTNTISIAKGLIMSKVLMNSELSLPGREGVDYPAHMTIPTTSFRCDSKPHSGYYADPEAQCQLFHICWGKRHAAFLCPLGTLFSQRALVCDWWYNVDCERNREFEFLNSAIGDPRASLDTNQV